ncbi:MAG: hypothetical protein LN413_02645 [Candidatus Thermoplasmatota archaeon]|nr:hypothetical protein [Candidatus Thermoplasmatota archaeon]
MAKIGNAEYPELILTNALEITDAIWREKISTIDALAKRLHHKTAKSGTFVAKLAALNKYYGLLDQDKTEIILTARAKRILMGPTDPERAEGRSEAVSAIPLLRDLYAKLGSDYNRDDFLPILRELAGATVEELHKKGGLVQRLYEDSVRYFPAQEVGTVTPEDSQPLSAGPAAAAGMLIVQVPGKPEIRVPWDPHFIESVRGFLESEKKALEESEQDKKGVQGFGTHTWTDEGDNEPSSS